MANNEYHHPITATMAYIAINVPLNNTCQPKLATMTIEQGTCVAMWYSPYSVTLPNIKDDYLVDISVDTTITKVCTSFAVKHNETSIIHSSVYVLLE